jgi:hypothetical protein
MAYARREILRCAQNDGKKGNAEKGNGKMPAMAGGY